VQAKKGTSNSHAVTPACFLFLAGFLFVILFNPEDEGNTFLRNVDERIPDYTVSHPRIFKATVAKISGPE
jgi:hypothetical protein